MARFATLQALNTDDALPDAWVDEVKAAHDYLIAAGADLASATTLTITSTFHKVTGTTTIDSVSDASGPVAGQRVTFAFQGTTTVRHNGGGTGNIRLLGGFHAGFVANEMLTLAYDGTNWIEVSRSPLHLCGELIVHGSPNTTVPSGYLYRDGSAVSRTTYAALFAMLGTQFGTGDGSTTFNLQDSRGRMPVGWAPSGGHADVSSIGGNDGTTLVRRRPKHRHTVNDSGHTHNVSPHGAPNQSGGSYPISVGPDGGTVYTIASASATTGITIGNDPTNDSLDAPSYLVECMVVRI
jgi:microcystin-dependent protein